MTVLLALRVEEGVGAGVALPEPLAVAVGVCEGLCEGVALLVSDTQGEALRVVEEVGIGEALTVLLSVLEKVGVGEALTTLLALSVLEEV